MNPPPEPPREQRTLYVQWLLNRIAEGKAAGKEEALNKLIDFTSERLTGLVTRRLSEYPAVAPHTSPSDVSQEVRFEVWQFLRKEGTQFPSSPREYYGLEATILRHNLDDLARRYDVPGRDTQPLPDHDLAGKDYVPWCTLRTLYDSLPEGSPERVMLSMWLLGSEPADICEVLRISPATYYRFRTDFIARIQGE